MKSINSIGIRIAVIVSGCIIIAFIGITLIKAAFTHTAIQQTSQTPQPTVPTSLNAIPTPEQSISPELMSQLEKFAKDATTKVGPVTKKYVESLPKDSEQSKVLDQDTITQYVAQNQGQLLQDLPADTVLTTTATGKTAIKTYLDSISPSQNTKLQNITGDTIVTAFQKQEGGEDDKALEPVLASIQSNYDILKAIKAPKEATTLHTSLLQATQALIANIQRVQIFKDDQINGLIGLKNISDLDSIFATISTQISTLEKKYNLQ